MARKSIPESIRDVLRYDPETGNLIWLINRSRGIKPGSSAGSIGKGGYVQVTYNYRQYLGHRLAWFLTNGGEPEMIDHINHDRSDNRLCNLRAVDNSMNQLNQKSAKKVYWHRHKSSGRCYVHTHYKKRSLYVGTNITTAWFRRIMAERSDHPIALPLQRQ